MADLFNDIVPAILENKKNVLDDPKDYIPFVVNKAMSFHKDCILYANAMNTIPSLDQDMQFQYLLNIVRPWKRPRQKWLKKEKIEAIDLIKEYYGYSNEKSRAALEVLTDDQIEEIKKNLDKGGSNGKSQRSGGGKAR